MPVYLLRADQCPLPMVPAGLLDPNADPATPLGFAAFSLGQTSGVALALNQNSRRTENIARYGGGAYGVADGRILSAGSGLNLAVATGVVMIDVPVVSTAADSLAITNNLYDAGDLSVRAHIWESRTGDLSLRTDLTQPGVPSVYLGSVRTSAGAFVDFDASGVLYLRGGALWRRTADLGAPTDEPDARLAIHTQTQDGLYLWDGETHRAIQGEGSGAVRDTIPAGAFAYLPAGYQVQVFGRLRVEGLYRVAGKVRVTP